MVGSIWRYPLKSAQGEPVPRVAAQPGLASAPGVLRAIGRRRVEIPGLGRAACLGSYAEVLRPGTVILGDRARIAA